MNIWARFKQNVKLRRFCVLLLLIIVLFLFRSMMSIILLTFIFTFLVTRLTQAIRKYVKIPAGLIVIVTYLLVIIGIYAAITTYIPQLAKQSFSTVEYVYHFYNNPSNDTNNILTWVSTYISKSDIFPQVKSWLTLALQYITNIGNMGVTFVLSFILSFFFTIEDHQMREFSARFLTSDFGWFFQDIYFFAKKFVNTFGVVLEAQFFIAIVNTAITTVILAIMQVPQLFSLSLMVFLLSLIPVAGVIISVVPLSLVGYSVGGIDYVLYILLMIIIVHTLEAYVLNPKFMSSRTELPIFYTFVVLIVSERVWGVWGLIVGVPIFNFFLDILGVKPIHGLKPNLRIRRRNSQKNDSDN